MLVLGKSQYSSVHVIISSRVSLGALKLGCAYVSKVSVAFLGDVRPSIRWLVLVLEVLVKSKALKSLVSEAAFTLLRG